MGSRSRFDPRDDKHVVSQTEGRSWSRPGTSPLQIPEFILTSAGGSLDFSPATTPTSPESPDSFDYSPRKPLVRAGLRREEVRGWDDDVAVEHATPSSRAADVSQSVDHSAQGNADGTFDADIPIARYSPAEDGTDLYPRLDVNAPPEPTASLGPAQELQNKDRNHFTRHIFAQQYEPVAARYSMQQVLGTGAMGEVWKCIAREDGRRWACKTIKKIRLQTPEDVESLRNEVAVMLELADHTAVVGLHDVVEDEEVQLALHRTEEEQQKCRSVFSSYIEFGKAERQKGKKAERHKEQKGRKAERQKGRKAERHDC